MNKKLYDLKELIEKRRASLVNAEGMGSVASVVLDSTEVVEVTSVFSDETSIIPSEPDVPTDIVESVIDTAIVPGDSVESTPEQQSDNGTKKKRRKK